jgi:hypothetical protein
MLQEIKLKAIYINDKKNDGTPYLNKKGQPFKMCVIEGDSGKKASMYIGMFAGAWDKKLEIVSSWKVNDTVKVDLIQDGQYLNFNLPTKTGELEERVSALEAVVFGNKSATENIPVKAPVNEAPPINDSEIPF